MLCSLQYAHIGILCFSQYAEITLFFSNSNIHPKSEYLRRLHEQKRFVDQFNEKTDHHVALIVDEYRPNEFTKMVLTNHLENEKEGGARCSACFNMRLDLVAQKAQELEGHTITLEVP